MALRFNDLRWVPLLFVSIAASFGADNGRPELEVNPGAARPNHQTSEKATIAAEPFETDEQTRPAFGKVNPYRNGILPVLVVIQNDSPNAIRVDRLKTFYVLPDRTRIETTP